MSESSFDLTVLSWIRARRPDGHVVEASLIDLFENAASWVGLAGEVPTQDAAVLRLLLAVIRRSFPEARSAKDWQRMWKRGSFEMEPILEYLDRHRDRFDLLHRETPFFQVADLHTSKGEMTGLDRLIADVPAGHQYFTTRAGSALTSMSFAEAARWLVHAQVFDPSGIKSGAVGDDRVKGGKGYPIGIAWCGWLGLVIAEGANLFETLMLNLQLGKSLPPAADDLPVWERDPQGPAVDTRSGAPTGPADLLTWQSRRIRLGHDGERVTGVLIANGDPLHPRDMFRREFMTSWRLSEAQMKAAKSADPIYMPRAHQPDRAVWRGLGSLLAETDRDNRSQAGRWLEWLDELVDDGALDETYPVRLHTVGMQYGAQSSVIDDITDDRMTLRAAVLAEPVLRTTAIDAVTDVDQTVRVLARLASDLTEAGGGDRDLCAVARDEAREHGYATLDAPYRRWLRELGPEIDREAHRLSWQETVRAIVNRLGRDLLNTASTAAWAGLPAAAERSQPLNAATAANWFHYNLRKALPVTEQEGATS